MKLLINRKPVDGPWGGGNHFIKAIFRNAKNNNVDLTTSLETDIDAILVIDPRYDELRISISEILQYKRRNPKTKIIHRINECDMRKGDHEKNDPLLRATSQASDVSIFISHWLLDHHHVDGKWECKDSRVILNGTDKKTFTTSLTNGLEQETTLSLYTSEGRWALSRTLL